MEKYKEMLEKYDLSSHIDYIIDSIKFEKDEKVVKELLVINKDTILQDIRVNLINSIDSEDYDKKLAYLMTKNDKNTWKKAIKHLVVQEIINGAVSGIELSIKEMKKQKKYS